MTVNSRNYHGNSSGLYRLPYYFDIADGTDNRNEI